MKDILVLNVLWCFQPISTCFGSIIRKRKLISLACIRKHVSTTHYGILKNNGLLPSHQNFLRSQWNFIDKVFTNVLVKKWMEFNRLKATKPPRGYNLFFTILFPGVPSTQLIDPGETKVWVDLGATQRIWTRVLWIGHALEQILYKQKSSHGSISRRPRNLRMVPQSTFDFTEPINNGSKREAVCQTVRLHIELHIEITHTVLKIFSQCNLMQFIVFDQNFWTCCLNASKWKKL